MPVQDEEKVTVVQAATNEAKPAAAIEEVQTVNATVGKKPLKGQHHEIFEKYIILRDLKNVFGLYARIFM